MLDLKYIRDNPEAVRKGEGIAGHGRQQQLAKCDRRSDNERIQEELGEGIQTECIFDVGKEQELIGNPGLPEGRLR